ncbi:hypothetical protein DFH06DRAFT_1128639 [Mycena polygramma]|nr:hypothetical protein DFH06DRAFT_1128639 [Mycena polygramma]
MPLFLGHVRMRVTTRNLFEFVFVTTGALSETLSGRIPLNATLTPFLFKLRAHIYLQLAAEPCKIYTGKYKNALHYEQKAEVEDYLHASGLPHVSLHLGAFLENYWTFNWRPAKDPHGLRRHSPILQLIRRSALHMDRALKNYRDASKGILGRVYTVLSDITAYGKLGEMTGQGAVHLLFDHPRGDRAVDEMSQAHAEHNMYADTPVPDPEFVALGVKFGTIEEFLEREEEAVVPLRTQTIIVRWVEVEHEPIVTPGSAQRPYIAPPLLRSPLRREQQRQHIISAMTSNIVTITFKDGFNDDINVETQGYYCPRPVVMAPTIVSITPAIADTIELIARPIALTTEPWADSVKTRSRNSQWGRTNHYG